VKGSYRKREGMDVEGKGKGMVRIKEGRRALIKKKIKFSLYVYREIQSGAVAKSYMTNGLPIYGEIFAHFLIY
jgi:hypothetical protein